MKVRVKRKFYDLVEQVDRLPGEEFDCEESRAIELSTEANKSGFSLVEILEDNSKKPRKGRGKPEDEQAGRID